MEKNIVLNQLGEIKKGSYLKIKKVKHFKNGVNKISDLVIRLGVKYGNIKKVQEKLNGREVGSLAWGHYLEGYEGLVIEHTNKKGETKYYLRVANDYLDRNKSYYYLNNKEISKDEAILIEGEKQINGNGQSPDVYNIEFNNLLSLGA